MVSRNPFPAHFFQWTPTHVPHSHVHTFRRIRTNEKKEKQHPSLFLHFSLFVVFFHSSDVQHVVASEIHRLQPDFEDWRNNWRKNWKLQSPVHHPKHLSTRTRFLLRILKKIGALQGGGGCNSDRTRHFITNISSWSVGYTGKPISSDKHHCLWIATPVQPSCMASGVTANNTAKRTNHSCFVCAGWSSDIRTIPTWVRPRTSESDDLTWWALLQGFQSTLRRWTLPCWPTAKPAIVCDLPGGNNSGRQINNVRILGLVVQSSTPKTWAKLT